LVVVFGVSAILPLFGTEPTPGAIVTESALTVAQLSVADSPAMMLVGVA
jgi:hypothetical protein